jgi:hypothetical protein
MEVIFVCLGNICRSPMAEAVFNDMVAKQGLSDKVKVESAGTGAWHVGEPACYGTRQVLVFLVPMLCVGTDTVPMICPVGAPEHWNQKMGYIFCGTAAGVPT